MAAIKGMIEKSSQIKKTQGPRFGVVMQISDIIPDGSNLILKGTSIDQNAHVKSGEPLNVLCDQKVVENLKSSASEQDLQGPLTVALTDNQLVGVAEDGIKTIKPGFLYILRSASKTIDYETAFASAPVAHFKNVTPQAGEPSEVVFSLNQLHAFDPKEREILPQFDIFWMKEKFDQARQSKVDINLDLDTIEPQNAMRIESREHLEQVIRGLMTNPLQLNRLFWMRVYDSTPDDDSKYLAGGRVITPAFDPRYNKKRTDPDATCAVIDKTELIPGIVNKVLFDGVESGDVALELIPGRRLRYRNNKAIDIIEGKYFSKALAAGQGEVQTSFRFTFGGHADNFASLILVGAKKEEVSGFTPAFYFKNEESMARLLHLPSAAIGGDIASNAKSFMENDYVAPAEHARVNTPPAPAATQKEAAVNTPPPQKSVAPEPSDPEPVYSEQMIAFEAAAASRAPESSPSFPPVKAASTESTPGQNGINLGEALPEDNAFSLEDALDQEFSVEDALLCDEDVPLVDEPPSHPQGPSSAMGMR